MISIDELIHDFERSIKNAESMVAIDKSPTRCRMYMEIKDRYIQAIEYLKELKAFRESERTGGSIEILVNNELSGSDKCKSGIEFAEDLRLLAEKYNIIITSHQITDTKMRRCKGCGNYTASDFCPKCGTKMEEC